MSKPDSLDPGANAPAAAGRTSKEKSRILAGTVIGGLLVAFSLLNLGRVEVDWVIGTWKTPLIVVIVLSVLVGAGIALAYTRLAAHRSARASVSGTSARDS